MKIDVLKNCLIYTTLCFLLAIIYLNVLFSSKLDSILADLDHEIIKTKPRFIEPFCKCLNDTLKINKDQNKYSIYSIGPKNASLKYTIKHRDYENNDFSCSEYHSLNSGPNLKIVSYSLYGKNRKYYSNIDKILNQINSFYGHEWIMRIYHDDSIDESIICKFECENPGRIQFCPIRDIKYFDFSNYFGMYWRWLPLMDNFVDLIQIRDLDSWIIEREYLAVSEWLKSNKLFHTMRDHPFHYFPILGGLWSLKSSLNRTLSKTIIQKLTNKNLIRPYNNKIYLEDQYFLTHHIWPIVKDKGFIHDSYYCEDFGSESFTKGFPSRRIDLGCFVSCIDCCKTNHTSGQILNHKSVGKKCPKKFRFKKEWEYC
ncbi:unnamed protein product [Brachionus calyciflorus]|uniref:Uncharacterized protein n=1 Tax=Brachionus calyciflorus TaxID=104777 RepID=A0A813MWI6_9BILA|nr:unnamed protein product [Brachionus calyciflorus]